MTFTYSTAIDEIFARFNGVWQGASALVGYVPEVRWQGVEKAATPDKDKYWCRVSTQNVLDQQTTLQTAVAPTSGRRYTSTGLVFVQLFCPMSDSRSTERGRLLAELARSAYRGVATAGGVWFRNARINELPPDEGFYRFNIIADYEFDEIA